MNESVFGEKAKEFERAPENLNDYIHVASPGIWILTIGMIFLLAGVLLWSLIGHIDRTVNVYSYSQDGKVICLVDEAYKDAAVIGQKVKINGIEGTIESVTSDNVFPISCEIVLPERLKNGIYNAEIVIERVKPISLITN